MRDNINILISFKAVLLRLFLITINNNLLNIQLFLNYFYSQHYFNVLKEISQQYPMSYLFIILVPRKKK